MILNRLLRRFSVLWLKCLETNAVVKQLHLILAKVLRMPFKQLFINLDQTILEEIKEKSADVEKRSLNSLARKLLADLPKDRGHLLELGTYFKQKKLKSLQTDEPVGLTLRFTEDEIWDLKEKAALVRVNPRELAIYLLELWNSNELESILQTLNTKIDLKKEKDAVKRVS